MKPLVVNLKTLTLKEIHEAIVSSVSLNAAASKLGVSGVTLRKFLPSWIHNDEPLSFDRLKAVALEEGPGFFSEIYQLSLNDCIKATRKRPRDEYGDGEALDQAAQPPSKRRAPMSNGTSNRYRFFDMRTVGDGMDNQDASDPGNLRPYIPPAP